MNPPYTAPFAGQSVTATGPLIVYYEVTGVRWPATNRPHALQIYLTLSQQPRLRWDKLHILEWSGGAWSALSPDSIKG